LRPYLKNKNKEAEFSSTPVLSGKEGGRERSHAPPKKKLLFCTQRSFCPFSTPIHSQRCHTGCLFSGNSKCGPWTISMSTTWELVRNALPRPTESKSATEQGPKGLQVQLMSRCMALNSPFPGYPLSLHPFFHLAPLLTYPTKIFIK
jgi:hypothetical protein